MTQMFLTRVPSSRGERPTAYEARSVASLALPLLGSLLQTYGVVWLLCQTPYAASLGWLGWLRTAIWFVAVAFLAHVAAVWVNRRLFRREVDAPGRMLVLAIWPAVVWVPLLILLTREQSLWSVVVPGVMAASAVGAIERWTGWDAPAPHDGRTILTLFWWAAPRPFLRVMAPALVCSAALHGATAEMLRGELLRAGWLLGLCVGLALWRYSAGPGPLPQLGNSAALGWRAVLPRTLLVWVLLLFALLPYVGSKRLGLAFGGALGKRPPPKAAGKSAGGERAPEGAYSGVILLFSAKPHREVVAPPPAAPVRGGFRERRPVLIPFDGAYWYFRQPDQGPRVDAPVVRDDPRRRTIRSTDRRPLLMEAHQRLGEPVSMSCCRAIRLTVQNGDAGQGDIALEVVLRNRMGRARVEVSLGSKVLPSSVPGHATGGDVATAETLSFRFPVSPGGVGMKSFDEITVVIRPRSDRARAGAHVAIESFALLP